MSPADGRIIPRLRPASTPSHANLADFTELLRPRYRRPLAIGISLMLFQQITGQVCVGGGVGVGTWG